ncbi:MAG: hypothetical protein ACOYOP_02850 [Microthrixaceae bacterium]
MATLAAFLVLVGLGVAAVWTAWRGSQGHHAGPGWADAAGPLGVGGGVCILGGVAAGVSGVPSPAGWVGIAFGLGGLAVGSVLAVLASRHPS